MIEVFDDVKKIVKSSLSYPLVIAKLHFFNYNADILEPFLKQFQTDKPMIVFLFFELRAIVTCLLEITVQPEVVEPWKSARQLKEIDLIDKTKLLPVGKTNNSFLVSVAVRKLKRSNAIISSQIKELKKVTQLLVIAMLSKLF